jgi:hypothetical protein
MVFPSEVTSSYVATHLNFESVESTGSWCRKKRWTLVPVSESPMQSPEKHIISYVETGTGRGVQYRYKPT